MKPILNLNKHPKDCENLSLINAKNVKLSNDYSCLQSENTLNLNQIIHSAIINHIQENYKIISLIPCNKELIIFVLSDTNEKSLSQETSTNIDIFRYNESYDICKIVYNNLDFYGGNITGDFTYNVNDELILAISEYNGIKDVPLRTINLGKFNDNKEQLNKELLSVHPEIKIPTLKDYDFVPGNLPKGWYYIFIRYKIDNNDYTNWKSISNKILVSLLEKQNIIKYYGKVDEQKQTTKTFVTGVYDYFNGSDEISNLDIKIYLEDLDNRYKNYQLGIIYLTNNNIKSFRTNDININQFDYILSSNKFIEEDYNDMIIETYLPFNVKNLINYQNRLYISNYKEKLLSDYDTKNIKLNLVKKYLNLYDLKTIQYLETSSKTEGFEVETIKPCINNLGTFEPIIIKDLIITDSSNTEKTTNTDIYSNIDLNDTNSTFRFRFYDKDISKAYGLSTLNLNRTFNIKSDLGYIQTIEFYASFTVFYVNNTWSTSFNIYFKYINKENKEYITRAVWYRPYYNETEYYFDIKLDNNKITSDILNSNQNISNSNSISFINTKDSFINRIKNSTLIGGEVYNFYIHFVDKYGQTTKGFKINNDSENNDIVKIPLWGFSPELDGISYNYDDDYLLRNASDNIFDEIGGINITDDECISIELSEGYGACISPQLNLQLKEYLNNKYIGFNNIKNLKWGQLPGTGRNNEFSIYINNNIDKFYKIPFEPIDCYIDEKSNYFYKTPIYSLNIENVTLPKDYIGYFLTYEKPTRLSQVTGFLTKFDSNEKYNSDKFMSYNEEENKYMRFYCSDFDINDNVNLKYNVLRLESRNCFKESNNFNRLENISIDYIANLNNPEIFGDVYKNVIYYYIKDYSIEIANDFIKDRFGVGTVLKIPIINELFSSEEIYFYKASLLYIDQNIYDNSDKTLIKCSNIIYDNNKSKFNFDGYITYNNFLVYNNNRFEYNSADKIVYTKEKNKYYDDIENIENTAKFLTYIQSIGYKEYFYETKSFKNNPKNEIFPLTVIDEEKDISEYKLQTGVIVEPLNSIDLFENKYNNVENLIPKIYQNNRTDLTYISQFDKFIRRSDIIQDESLSNSWRNFRIENYKIIAENKGKITNLVGIGTYLLVHTEHSLFSFNRDNTLKTEDKNVLLKMPDIFDVDYTELITSDLGHAGLQDSNAAIVDQFGYIFYDNDSNRLFRFDENKLDYIDLDIVQFLQKYKPYDVIFAHDKKSNRILIKLNFTDIIKENTKVLSYNYLINKFISFHDYNFNKGINTKNQLYLLDINKINLYQFDYFNIKNISYQNPCQLDIIINDNYNIIKQLEYIIYKLYKIKYNTDKDYIDSPVEDMKLPYSGEQIRVYNNEVDTGWLDIKIDTEESKNVFSNYNKPYWDLGNWNFNYLRNKISDKLGLDLMSKLYGNYFIVSIIFGDSNERVEFESLGYNITKDKRI